MGKQEASTGSRVDLTEGAERRDRSGSWTGTKKFVRSSIFSCGGDKESLLAGEAGVGKTAGRGVRGEDCQGDVPPALRDVTLRSLDLGLLQAGRAKESSRIVYGR